MIDLDPLSFLLACAGFTFFLTQSLAGEPIRNLLGRVRFFRELLGCSFCTGFWVSMVLACLTPMGVSNYELVVVTTLRAFAGAILAYAVIWHTEAAVATTDMVAMMPRPTDDDGDDDDEIIT